MLYNILFIINQKYFEFAKIALHSLIKNTDFDNIKSIFVADIGLNPDAVDYLKNLSPKINLIDTGESISYSKDAHTPEWFDAVCMKTKVLYDLAQDSNNLPLVLVDTDIFFVKDFSHLINLNKPIQICKRFIPSARPDMSLDYIGSFLIINNQSALEFIKSWIECIKTRIVEQTYAPYETPALCLTVQKFQNLIALVFLNENAVSCDNNYIENETCIIHLKSITSSEDDNLIAGRLKYLKNFNPKTVLRFLNYNFITENQYLEYKKTRKSKIVCYTFFTEKHKKLLQPTYISKDWDYVCFYDSDFPTDYSDCWQFIKVNKNDFYNITFYKLFPAQFFPDYDYSIWLDADVDILNNELENRIIYLISSNTLIACNSNKDRNSVYEEANFIMLNAHESIDIILKQVEFMKAEGLNDGFGLFDTNIIFRKHNDNSIKELMQYWWSMLNVYSSYDVLSFMFSLFIKNIVCEKIFAEPSKIINNFLIESCSVFYYSALFVAHDNDFNTNDALFQKFSIASNGKFSLFFNFHSSKYVKSVKLLPVIKQFCNIKLHNIQYETSNSLIKQYDLSDISTNGMINQNNEYVFKTIDPYFILNINANITNLSFEGEIIIHDLSDTILSMHNELDYIYNSRLWKLFVKTNMFIKKVTGKFNIKSNLKNN